MDEEELELPDLGIHVITITVNDDPRVLPELDYGSLSPWVVTSILRAAIDSMDILIPPLELKSNGEIIVTHSIDMDDELEYGDFDDGTDEL